ncbi:trehalase-like domain-containing protein [Candidatus Mycobacterium methanotrophicum]|uniref:trehalase-like domain-containing protein n=1 Tax=Candidatus Mycobacterium methanotrophicum TaxID=2943498 RepID=UPI0027D95C0F|nr:trehalase-like domain-containing protein [Candidatus Mycobacterium methanotrophicum]
MQLGETVSEQLLPQVLRQYALLADGERGILVGPRGDFCWMCLPRWDGAALFNSLLGGGGVYAVSPDDARFVWGRQLLPPAPARCSMTRCAMPVSAFLPTALR